MFSGGVERDFWHKMGQILVVFKLPTINLEFVGCLLTRQSL